jgi:hypothetical protein
MIRFTGVKSLGAFTDDSHTADMDDLAIVFAAIAELVPEKERPKWEGRLGRRLTQIRANAVVRRRIKLFSGQSEGRERRGPPRVYYRTT